LAAEVGLYDAKNELAMLSRALGGHTALGGETAQS